jgi:hypothetical protein
VGSKLLNLVQRKPDKVVVLILSAPRLLVIKLVKNTEVRVNKWHLRNRKKIQHLVMVIKEKQPGSVDLMLKKEHLIAERKNNSSGHVPLF